MSNPGCVYSSTMCVSRQCPYLSPSHCFQDTHCQWDYSNDMCAPSDCTKLYTDATSCNANSTCNWLNSQCVRTPCKGTTAVTCMSNTLCLWTGSTCKRTKCDTETGTVCQADTDCSWTQDSTTKQMTCITNRCKSLSSNGDCNATATAIGATCAWYAGSCNVGAAPASCEKEVTPNLWWLYLLCLIIFVLLGLIAWRLYLAYAKGLSFFEPARTNVKYSPHQQYAADLFEEAQNTGVETNATGYQRPNSNDL